MARILVVDDDSQIRGVVARLLKGANHEVTDVASGREAITAVQESHFDALLIDLVMPEQGGIETIMEIHRVVPGLPTIVMSGKIPVQTDAVNRLVEQFGAKSVLAKPFTSKELMESVTKAL